MPQKLAKKQVVVAEMFIVGSTSLYFIQQAYPSGGFIRDLIAISITGLVSSFFSFALEKTARRKYLAGVTVVVTLLLFTACWVKFSLMTALAEAFSAVKFARIDLDDPKYHLSSADPNYIPDQQKWSDYWKNY